MADTAEKAILLKEVPFNISRQVKVRLTDRGLETLIKRIQEEDKVSQHEAAKRVRALYMRGEDFIFTLFELMAWFGPKFPTVAIQASRYDLFEGYEIILLPDPWEVTAHERETAAPVD